MTRAKQLFYLNNRSIHLPTAFPSAYKIVIIIADVIKHVSSYFFIIILLFFLIPCHSSTTPVFLFNNDFVLCSVINVISVFVFIEFNCFLLDMPIKLLFVFNVLYLLKILNCLPFILNAIKMGKEKGFIIHFSFEKKIKCIQFSFASQQKCVWGKCILIFISR